LRRAGWWPAAVRRPSQALQRVSADRADRIRRWDDESNVLNADSADDLTELLEEEAGQ
jgi:hypothetical protein